MDSLKLDFGRKGRGIEPAPVRDSARVEGEVERVVYESAAGGYRVLRVTVPGRVGVVTLVGSVPSLKPGQVIRAEGRWETDRRFGRQFRATLVEVVAPTTAAGVERYLSSGLVKGIGPGTAKKIVEVLGVEALRVIAADPARLHDVRGLSRAKAAALVEAVETQLGVGDTYAFLHSVGLGAALARRVIQAWGRDTTRRIQANPYDLASEIRGIGFHTADQLARSLGIPEDSPLRVRAAVLHGLDEMAGRGHVFVPDEVLVREVASGLGAAPAAVEEAVLVLTSDSRLIAEPLRSVPGRALYLPALAAAERGAAAALAALLRTPSPGPAASRESIDATVAAVERELQVELAPLQRDAVRAAIERKIVVITGGPGTGKTTIIRAIVRVLARGRQRFALAAPTGRAARRMAEATGNSATTLHRLLEFHPPTGAFQRGREMPLDLDWLVVDEASMVDLPLFGVLLEALPPGAHLVLVGDADQLPSVGPGAVLADVIACGAVPVVRLSEIFRQAAASGIVVNAHRVNHGEVPRGETGDEWPDFFTIDRADPEDAQKLVIEMVAERIPRKFGLDPLTQIQVLAPMRKGVLGTLALNEALRERLNPKGVPVGAGARGLRVGDRVMQFANNYRLEVMNGEVGRIEEAVGAQGEVRVRFDDRVVSYPRTDLDSLDLAYACSIHKSQGSEYPAVVIPIHTQHYVMLRRNLLYTAITRGKKVVVIVGSAKARRIAVQEAQLERRYSRLAERLSAALGR